MTDAPNPTRCAADCPVRYKCGFDGDTINGQPAFLLCPVWIRHDAEAGEAGGSDEDQAGDGVDHVDI